MHEHGHGHGYGYGYGTYVYRTPCSHLYRLEHLYLTPVFNTCIYISDVTRGTPVEALIAQRLAEIEAKSSRPGSPNANDENACAAMKNM